jgi:hypothetical protein
MTIRSEVELWSGNYVIKTTTNNACRDNVDREVIEF